MPHCGHACAPSSDEDPDSQKLREWVWQEYERQTKPSTLTWKSLQLAPEERVAACMQKLPRMCAAGKAQPPRPCAMTRVAARGWSRTVPPALHSASACLALR